MMIIETAEEMRQWSRIQCAQGHKTGFVPTMGYLHEGHLSLVDLAREEADQVVVSIFVNPTQFGTGEDFNTYPRDIERDISLCTERGVDLLYHPPKAEMYPFNHSTNVDVDRLGDFLCGSSRPGHFRGVTTVVTMLFNTIQPDVALFGRKDAQQARIIEQMVDDLQFGIKIIIAPVVREEDGLALSSRNVRLGQKERKQASSLYRGLKDAVELFMKGEKDAGELRKIFLKLLKSDAPDGSLDYVEVVNWENMEPVDRIESKAMIAAAVKFGDVRLIDNMMLE